MRFELVKKVPIVEIGGKRCFLDTGFPRAFMPVCAGVPCEFAGHPFEILCGDAQDNPAYVPSEGVIGYDFFANFTLVVDRLGGKMTFVKN